MCLGETALGHMMFIMAQLPLILMTSHYTSPEWKRTGKTNLYRLAKRDDAMQCRDRREGATSRILSPHFKHDAFRFLFLHRIYFGLRAQFDSVSAVLSKQFLKNDCNLVSSAKQLLDKSSD